MVFSNTTPFIALSSVNLLHLLPSIFDEIVVAPSVVDECSEGGRIMVPDLSTLSWVKVMPIQSQLHLPALFELAAEWRCGLGSPISRPQLAAFGRDVGIDVAGACLGLVCSQAVRENQNV